MSCPRRASVLGDDRDLPDDVVVEVAEFLGGVPQLDQVLTAGRMRFETPEVLGLHVVPSEEIEVHPHATVYRSLIHEEGGTMREQDDQVRF